MIDIDSIKNRMVKCKEIWENAVRDLNINEDTVVLVLSGENSMLDYNAVENLNLFVERKKALRAEILISDDDSEKMIYSKKYSFPIRVTKMNYEDLCKIYDYYCFAFNLENIAFTFLNHCHYNLMGKVLDETSITEMEAVCLGVYWLNELPGNVADE